jgi:hypothetical protein
MYQISTSSKQCVREEKDRLGKVRIKLKLKP